MELYQRILCPIDDSDTADLGMREAVRLAKATGASLRLLHVVELQPALFGYEGAATVGDVMAALEETSKTLLERARGYAAQQGVQASVGSAQAVGNRASDAIVEEADRMNADLIVIGTHGRRGVRRLVIGSNAELVARQANCAVLLVRQRPAADV